MKKIDCKKKCKKTSMLRSSKYCEGFAIYEDGKLKYSCDSNLESLSIKEKSFYNCDFYDIEEYSQCYKCPLDCKNNKSIVKKARDSSKRRANAILDDIQKKYPINSGALEIARNNINRDLSPVDRDALNAVSFAQSLLNSAMSGKMINAPLIRRLRDAIKNQNKT